MIAIYFYNGNFYLPTCVRSLDGRVGITDPVTIISAEECCKLAEEIEFQAVAGNATLSNADFRLATDSKLIAAMRLTNRQAFYSETKRWNIVEDDGAYTLIPFKPAAIRGVTEDSDHAVALNPATFAEEAIDVINAQLGKTSNYSGGKL